MRGRVFAELDSTPADRFGRRMAERCEMTGSVNVATDGKAALGSPEYTFSGCLNLISGWAVANLKVPRRVVPSVTHWA